MLFDQHKKCKLVRLKIWYLLHVGRFIQRMFCLAYTICRWFYFDGPLIETKKASLIVLAALVIPGDLYSQSKEIENLRREIRNHPQQDTFRVNRLTEICRAYPRIEPEEMKQFSDEALLISKRLGYSLGEAYALTGQAMASYLSGNREKAFALLANADRMANQSNDDVLKFWVLLRHSNSYRGYDYPKALSWALEAESLAIKMDNKKLLSLAQWSVAEVSRNSSNCARAMEYCLKSEKSAEEANCLSCKVFSWLQLAYLYALIGDYAKSNEYYEKQTEAISLLGFNGSFVAHRLNGLGENYRLTGNYPEALYYYQQSLALHHGLYSQAFVESEIADVYVRTDSLPLAFRYAFSSLRKAKQIDNVFLESSVCSVISRAYHKSGVPDSAFYYASHGLVKAKKVGSLEIIRDNTLALANAYALRGDFKNTYDYHKQYIHYRDTMLDAGVKNKMAVLEHTFALEKKQSEIVSLSQQKDAQQNYLIAISAILILFVVAAMELFRSNKQKTKYVHDRQLLISTVQAQEDERKRIAQDLHDELGAVLSIARMHIIQIRDEEEGSNLKAGLQQACLLTESALTTMRKISHELMPPQLEEFGLIKTLRAIATQVNDTRQIEMELIADDDSQRWSITVERGLYRVCMEMINNTLKHAHARHILIQIRQHPETILLTYQDDGTGLPETYTTGQGFRNIEARMNILSGTVQIRNQPTGGFSAVLNIPTTPA